MASSSSFSSSSHSDGGGGASRIASDVVAAQFVRQYYHVLEHRRDMLPGFYVDVSLLGHPDAHGNVDSISSVDEISKKIMSTMGPVVGKPKLKTVDAQPSFRGGVMVLVRGSLTTDDDVERDFTQTFFLAPQETGFYVRNDIFRYVEKEKKKENDAPQQQSQQVEKQISDMEADRGEEYTEEIKETRNSSIDDVVVQSSCVNPAPQEGQRKLSYAEIVKAVNSSAPMPVPARALAAVLDRPRTPSVSTAVNSSVPMSARVPAAVPDKPATPPISTTSSAEKSYLQDTEIDRYSVCVKNLPFNATPALVEEEMKKFGPIKLKGIQVRSNLLHQFCYGFVEFEMTSAAQNAIQASPIMIGGRKAYVQEKRVTGGRRRNGGFCNDGARGRGDVCGGRGYPKAYSGRGRAGGRGGSSRQN